MSTVSESGQRLRLALVGAGVIGTIHAAVISELADRIDLVAVVDVHLDRAEKLAAEHGGNEFGIGCHAAGGRSGDGLVEAVDARVTE